MKALILFSFLYVSLHVSLNAERIASNQPRVPPVPVEQAIKLVHTHHNQASGVKLIFIDEVVFSEFKPIFVDEVVFVKEVDKSYWKVGVRNIEYETGHLFYTVSSDGKVALHSVVKDG